jgi:hypothetical protein
MTRHQRPHRRHSKLGNSFNAGRGVGYSLNPWYKDRDTPTSITFKNRYARRWVHILKSTTGQWIVDIIYFSPGGYASPKSLANSNKTKDTALKKAYSWMRRHPHG